MRSHALALLLMLGLAACGTPDPGATSLVPDDPQPDMGLDAGIDAPDPSPDPTEADTDEPEEDASEDAPSPDVAPEDTDLPDVDSPEDVADPPDIVEDTIEDAAEDVAEDATEDIADADMPDAEPDVEEEVPDPPTLDRTCDLLFNTGAENNNIDGWEREIGNFGTTRAQFLRRPEAYEGEFSFYAGQDDLSVLSQTIDLSERAEAVDTLTVYALLGAQVRNWSGDDGASLLLTALDADMAELSQVQAGPYLADDWTARSVQLQLPPGTRHVRASLRGDKNNGRDNDAYFDAIELCLDTAPEPLNPDTLNSPPYLMWVTTDAVSVRWETDTPTLGRVDYGLTPDLGQSVEESEARRVHEVRLTGLTPGQRHHYQISVDGAPLSIRSFKTAPDPDSDAPFSFIVWGDNQNGPDIFRDMTPVMADENPDFALNVGDCVQNGTRREYREQLFGPLAGFADQVPFLVAAGNHERYSDRGADLFDEYMSQPGDEHCFGWRYGNLYTVFIDTELSIDPGSAQDTCIREALASPEALSADFRAAAFHKPPRIEWWVGGVLAFTRDMEAPWVRETLAPLLEEMGVDIVFNGHNHLYAHTPTTPGGTVWVTTGGGGGGLDTDSGLWRVGEWPEIETTLHEHHFLSIAVDGPQMIVTAVGTDGVPIHQFTVEAR